MIYDFLSVLRLEHVVVQVYIVIVLVIGLVLKVVHYGHLGWIVLEHHLYGYARYETA